VSFIVLRNIILVTSFGSLFELKFYCGFTNKISKQQCQIVVPTIKTTSSFP